MMKFILVGMGSGILFGVMDGLINANPLAQKLYRVYEPIARKSISVPAGVAIDLVFGLAMAGVFLVLRKALPGESWMGKGAGVQIDGVVFSDRDAGGKPMGDVRRAGKHAALCSGLRPGRNAHTRSPLRTDFEGPSLR